MRKAVKVHSPLWTKVSYRSSGPLVLLAVCDVKAKKNGECMT